MTQARSIQLRACMELPSPTRTASCGARENGLRYDSVYFDLGVRDAGITAHAAFRKRLYDHDVVPDAQAAAATLM